MSIHQLDLWTRQGFPDDLSKASPDAFFYGQLKRNQPRYKLKPCRVYRLQRIVETGSLHLTARPFPCAPEIQIHHKSKCHGATSFGPWRLRGNPSAMMGSSNQDQRRPDLSVLHVFRHRLPKGNIFRANTELGCHLHPNGTGHYAICRRQQARK